MLPKRFIIAIMIDLKDLRLKDLAVIKSHQRLPKGKAHCTFYRIKRGSYMPKRTKHRIADLPKGLYDEFFQKGV